MESLEGWLSKRKSSESTFSMFSKDNKRWFKVKEVKSIDTSELALCYYKSPKEKEPRGWIYLRDVTSISDDEKSFTVISAARSMTLEAPTRAEHRLWLFGLVSLCPQANTSNIISKSPTNIPKKVNVLAEHRRDDSKAEYNNNNLNNNNNNLNNNNNNLNSRSSDDKSQNKNWNKNQDDLYRSESKNEWNDRRNNNNINNNNINDNEDQHYSEAKDTASAKEPIRMDSNSSNSFASTKNNYTNSQSTKQMSRNDSNDMETVSMNNPSSQSTGRYRYREDSNRNSSDENDEEEDDAVNSKTAKKITIKSNKSNHNVSDNVIDDPVIPSIKSAPKLPPSDAPPRRAKDALKEAETAKPRQSIDEIITRSRQPSNDLDLSDDEFDKEFKAERRMQQMWKNHYDASTLPDTMKKSDNTKKPKDNDNWDDDDDDKANAKTNVQKPTQMKQPPGKAPIRSQVVADSNFVHENWDDDDDDYEPRNNRNNNNNNNRNQINSRNGQNKVPVTTVQADKNWLSENFDD